MKDVSVEANWLNQVSPSEEAGKGKGISATSAVE